jgi:hypothetical protein
MISGKIIDKKTSEPLPYVNIVIKENSKVVTGASHLTKVLFK